MASESRASAWITFIGVLFLLVGVYAVARTAVNLKVFDKYPQDGVLNFNFGMPPMYYQREQDCTLARTYYDSTTQNMRPPTSEERGQETRDQATCLATVADARQRAKVNDMGVSAFFLFLGVGILASRRFFFN